MSNRNIQSLFSTIRLEQVVAFLDGRGWQVNASDDRIDFQSPPNSAGETRRVFLPAQQSHPKFRHLLPNLVFTLAVTEEREAIDIANEIADTAVRPRPAHDQAASPSVASSIGTAVAVGSPPSLPASQVATVERLRKIVLVNAGSAPAEITHGQSMQPFALPSGHGLAVVVDGSTACRIDITGACSIGLGGDRTAQVLLEDLPDARPIPDSQQADWLALHLSRLADRSVATEGDIPDWAVQAARRFVFQVGHCLGNAVGRASDGGELSGGLQTFLRATAMLLCEVRHRIVSADLSSRSNLFAAARLCLSLGQGTFSADGEYPESLAETVLRDDALAPLETVGWLKARVRILPRI